MTIIEKFDSVESLFINNTKSNSRQGVYTAQEIALRVNKSRSSIHKEINGLIIHKLIVRRLLTVDRGQVVVYIWQNRGK